MFNYHKFTVWKYEAKIWLDTFYLDLKKKDDCQLNCGYN